MQIYTLMRTNGRYIFLADDDVDDRVLFEDALREVCKETVLATATDGQEMMNKLQATVPPEPDVIFLDLNMPVKNGFECLEEIKSATKLKNIPIIVLSTSSEKEYVDKVYAQGADYYLCKPDSFNTLKKAITSILNYDWSKHPKQPSRDSFLLSF